MEAAAHDHHDHHEMPTSGRALDAVALSATLHCLTGCALGEIAGMVIGTALGFSDLATIALAVALAFLFGYTLTSFPLLRAGLALGAVIPIAFASDTISIAIMEVVDNAILLVIPGAMDSGVDDVLFWGALSVALVVAGAFAFPANRWLIARGRGHTAVHETGIHGGPPVRLVGIVAAAAAIFGTTVLIAEATGGDGAGHGGHMAAGGGEPGQEAQEVRGLGVVDDGLELELRRSELARGREQELRFRIVAADGRPIRDFQVEHTKRMHLIVARRDMTGFQHLHPRLGGDGEWSTPITLGDAGSYRVFADFKRGGENRTLAADLGVDGAVDWRPLPAPSQTAEAGGGYQVRLAAGPSNAGRDAELGFTVTRGGEEVHVDDYLGAKGHLVALREGDLAYLHVHPAEGAHGDHGDRIAFVTEFPSAARYRLFLQFKHQGRVRTAAFTRELAAGG